MFVKKTEEILIEPLEVITFADFLKVLHEDGALPLVAALAILTKDFGNRLESNFVGDPLEVVVLVR